jgi:hypothetical protein
MKNISYDDFIWGDKFKKLSNCIFIKIDDALNFLKNNKVNKLITHNGDYCVDEKYINYLHNINFWFGQNVFLNDPKIISIPIGLENDYVSNSINKKKMLLYYMKENISCEKLLYINHNIGTNPKERSIPYQVFQTNKFITVESCMGYDNQKNYYTKVKQHAFVLSPPGNGIDCHRTWEILYCGRYPILKNIGRLKHLYEDLPVIFIDSYDEITEEFLLQKQTEFKDKTFNYNKLKFDYWKILIENYGETR